MIQSRLPRWPDRDKVPPHWTEEVAREADVIDFPEGVSVAKPHNMEEIYGLAIMAHHESGYGDMDVQAVRGAIAQGCHGNGGVFGVINGPRRIEAAIGLRLEKRWYAANVAGNWHHQDILTYVHPEHRRTRHFARLMHFARWWGKETKMPVVIGLTLAGDFERKEYLYARHGRKIGSLFMVYGPDDFPPKGIRQ